MFNRNIVLVAAAVAALGVVRAQDASSTDVSYSESATAPASASSSPAANASTTVVPISTAMIPTNISTSCSSFLDKLNSDSQFTACMAPLANITALYNPVVAANSSSDASTASTVTSTLTQLCASSTGCSDELIRSYLSSFYSSCSAELIDPNAYSKDVREIYDFLYVVNPFKGAVCSKNGGTQRYCVLEIAASAVANASSPVVSGLNSTTEAGGSNSTASNSTGIVATFKNFAVTQDLFRPQVALAAANLVIVQTANTANTLTRRFLSRFTPRAEGDSSADSTIITPNTTTYLTTGIAYLFLQPNMSSSLLCTTCTKSILASYVAWESQVPYALGLASSPILGKQAALWNSVASTCGSNFTDSIAAQAGVKGANSTGAGSLGTSAASSTFSASTGLVGIVGAMVVGVAALL